MIITLKNIFFIVEYTYILINVKRIHVTYEMFKNKLKINQIEVFDFCIKNEINPILISNLGPKDFIMEDIEDKLNNHIERIKNLEAYFLDKASTQGLKIINERVQIPLQSKNEFLLNFDSNLLGKNSKEVLQNSVVICIIPY